MMKNVPHYSYFRTTLANLAGIDLLDGKFVDKEEAYRQLKETTGQDFGFNVVGWKAWLIRNAWIPHDNLPVNAFQLSCLRREPIERLLANLEFAIAPDDTFIGRNAAVTRLKEITGQDFGYDAQQWRYWLQKTNYPHRADILWHPSILTEYVLSRLKAAGWTPDRRDSIERWVDELRRVGLTVSSTALRILENYGGLTAGIYFDPTYAETEVVHYWEGELGIKLSPIGEDGPGTILLAEDGRVFEARDSACFSLELHSRTPWRMHSSEIEGIWNIAR
jgi:hypothetical protein